MPKSKGDKNFMTLTQTECLLASKHLLDNADSLYNDAQLLAKNKSYGRATSMLIHSTEETMKAVILILDGNGFQFRKRADGINHLFSNHSLRYGLAMVISLLDVLSKDLNGYINKIKLEPNKFISQSEDMSVLEGKLLNYFKKKIKIIIHEVNWFSKAEFLRQEGFYVDYVDKIKTPLEIKEDEYNDVLVRIDGMKSVVMFIIDCFKNNDEEFKKDMDKLKQNFLMEDWYQNLGKLIKMFRDRRINPLEKLSLLLNDFSIEIQSKQTFAE